MAVKQYDIIFKGEIVDGIELRVAKQQLAALFKIDNDKVDALFSGKAITLKRNLPFAVANKYRVAIKKSGSLVEVVQNDAQAEGAVASKSSADSRHAHIKKEQDAKDSLSAAMQLLPVGVDLADTVENTVVPNVDVSHITVRENTGLLIDDAEKEIVAPVEVDTSGLSVKELGADVLAESERVKPVSTAIDVSHLVLDESDTPLKSSRKFDQPAPDTSHLSLVESQ